MHRDLIFCPIFMWITVIVDPKVCYKPSCVTIGGLELQRYDANMCQHVSLANILAGIILMQVFIAWLLILPCRWYELTSSARLMSHVKGTITSVQWSMIIRVVQRCCPLAHVTPLQPSRLSVKFGFPDGVHPKSFYPMQLRSLAAYGGWIF